MESEHPLAASGPRQIARAFRWCPARSAPGHDHGDGAESREPLVLVVDDEAPIRWEGEAFLDKLFSTNGLLEAVSLLMTGSVGGAARVKR